MDNYITVEEMSAKWNVTTHHIQLLCREGKVEGAIKRAGAWFIPEDAPSPVKNSKSGAKGFKFIGTKSSIFDSAIKLFMLRGFNAVSLNDIADDVGIRQSTIYNHFKSKQDILDTIYDFYCHYYLKDRPSLAEMELVVQNESPIDIIKRIRYNFNEDYRQKMTDITKIMFKRVSVDERAREIGKSLMVDEGVKYVEDVFNKGIEVSRFAPFNTHVLAVLINGLSIFALYNWIVDPSPDNAAKLEEDEQMLYQYATGLLTDLKPPVKNGREEP